MASEAEIKASDVWRGRLAQVGQTRRDQLKIIRESSTCACVTDAAGKLSDASIYCHAPDHTKRFQLPRGGMTRTGAENGQSSGETRLYF